MAFEKFIEQSRKYDAQKQFYNQQVTTDAPCNKITRVVVNRKKAARSKPTNRNHFGKRNTVMNHDPTNLGYVNDDGNRDKKPQCKEEKLFSFPQTLNLCDGYIN
jgi:hypothetical protein